MQTIDCTPYWPNTLRFFARAAEDAARELKNARSKSKIANAAQRVLTLSGSRDEIARYLSAVWQEKYPEVGKDAALLAIIEKYAA